MNFEWILLAFFLASMINGIAKALTRPMHKNILNLISIPVAFITALILQATGWFRSLADSVVESFNLEMGTIGEFASALITTLVGPVIFVLAYCILLFVIRLIHVNLVALFIESRQIRKERHLLRLAIAEEKELVESSVIDAEYRAMELVNALTPENEEHDFLEGYDPLTKREIEQMVEERISREKRIRKKLGFFKESSQKKTISLITGAVSGFLAFAIMMMPVFYTMSFISDVTDTIDKNDPQENKIYLAIELLDEAIVQPYESSFVYEIYHSMALVDLMNSTVRLGGRIAVGDTVYYADDVVRDIMKNSVKVATQIMSSNPNPEILKNSLNGIIKQPFVLSLLTNAVTSLMANVEIPDGGEEGDILSSITNGILLHYKNADKAIIEGDIGALTDTIVELVKMDLIMGLITGEMDFASIIADKDNIKGLLGTMSGLSVYDKVMLGAFTLGIDMIGPMLGIAADDAVAYEKLMNSIATAADSVSVIGEELEDLYTLFKNVDDFTKNKEQIAFIENRIAALKTANGEDVEAWTEADKTKLNELNTQLAEMKSASSDVASVLDYIIEPLRVAELLVAQGDEIKAKVEALEEAAKAAEQEGKDLELQATNIGKEIEAITEKAANGEISNADAAAQIEALYGEKANLESRANEFAARAEELSNQGVEIAEEAEALVAQGEALIDDFQTRITGFTPFISQFMNWMNVQKPFMLSGEDTSPAALTIKIDGVTYMCNTDIINIEMLIDLMLGGNDDSSEGGDTTGDDTDAEGGDVTDDTPVTVAEGDETGEGTGDDSSVDTGFDLNVDELLEQIPFRELLEQLTITSDRSEIESKASPVADLINFIIESASNRKTEGITSALTADWVEGVMQAFLLLNTNEEENASIKLANKLLDSENFISNSVTIEKMHASLRFGEDWTTELKKQDSEKLVDVIFTLIDLVGSLGGESDGESSGDGAESAVPTSNETTDDGGDDGGEVVDGGNDSSEGSISTGDMSAILDLLGVLGTTFDIMADTYCLADLPPLMLEGILKNEMLSMVMMPSMLNGYLEEMKQDDFSYETFMNEFVKTFVDLIGQLGEGGIM